MDAQQVSQSSTPAQWPDPDTSYFIVPAGGLANPITRLLHVNADNSLGFVATDDGSGRQLWRFTKGSADGIYTISPLTCGWPNGGFLSCHLVDNWSDPDGRFNRADIWSEVDTSGRQQWTLTPLGDGSFTFTITIETAAALQPHSDYKYLSCKPDGTVVDLWWQDGGGLQQWRLLPWSDATVQSNLTSKGYDLVCAVTQQALDNLLRQYVLGLNLKPFSCCFGPSGPITLDTVKGWLGGTDPFTLPTGPGKIGGVSAEFVTGFWWGFKATPYTLPLPKPLPKLPDVVVLDQGPSSVRHQVSFIDFEWITLEPPFEGWDAWLQYFKQDAANPCVFSSRTDLKSGDVNFAALPSDLQASLKERHSGGSFSIKQLFLDLSTSSIIGVDPPMGGTTAIQINANDVVTQYWKQVVAEPAAGPGLVVAYSVGVQATGSDAPAPSVTPTALGYVVSPHLGPDGKPDGQLGPGGRSEGNLKLSTLNYAAMTENRSLPVASPFAWNWVGSTNDAFNGVMSIRRDIFAEFLASLNPAGSLCIQPSIADDGSYTLPIATSPPPWLTSTGSELLKITFEYDSSGRASIGHAAAGLSDAPWDLSYTMNGDISFGTNTLMLKMHVVTNVSVTQIILKFGAGPRGTTLSEENTVSCKIVDYTQTATYTLSVDGNGQLTVNTETLPDADDHADTPPGDWSYNFISSFKAAVQDAVQKAINDLADNIKNKLQGTTSWVFPGGQTFEFEDVTFSGSGDLMAHIDYQH